MLRIASLDVAYGQNKVLDNISFHVEKGDFLTVIGVNGSGKSTILKTVSRMIKPKEGIVYLDGRQIKSMSYKEIAMKMTSLPQVTIVPDDFTVEELISYGRFPHQSFLKRIKKDDLDVIKWAMNCTNINDLKDRYMSTLSGGERQRAWIALALAQQTDILLLDEPTTFLDIAHQYEILELIKSLNEEHGITILMVLHDLNQAMRYSKKLMVLKDGQIYRIGDAKHIVNEELLQDVFKIEVEVYHDTKKDYKFVMPK